MILSITEGVTSKNAYRHNDEPEQRRSIEMKRNRIIRVIVISLILLSTVTFMPALSDSGDVYAASKPKKMTAYGLIKDGNMVYCNNGMYTFKVNLKTKKVTRLAYDYGVAMKKKGRYLYCFNCVGGGVDKKLYRIDTKTNKKKQLAKHIWRQVE